MPGCRQGQGQGPDPLTRKGKSVTLRAMSGDLTGALEWVRARLPGTVLASELTGLADIYRQADGAAASWQARSGFACPPGCGVCCERFDPLLSAPEADGLAAWLLAYGRGLVGALEDPPEAAPGPVSAPPSASGPGRSRCPFHDPSRALHCLVYPARPLVCRLFGFAGSAGKRGETVFRPCPHGPAGFRPPAPLSAVPARMSESGHLLAVLCGGRPGSRPLRPAVRSALERIGLLLRLSAPPDAPSPPQAA